MNIIVYSKRLGRAHPIELGRPMILTFALALVFTLFSGVLLAGVQIGRTYGLTRPAMQLQQWGLVLQKQSNDVAATRQELQQRLEALAGRIGQMNAHVIRLDALGRRLTEMAKLDKGEFNFDTAPALGGPEGIIEGTLVGSPDLSTMLDVLANQIKDRETQLSALESLISTRDLRRQILPGGRPVLKGWISSYFGQRTDPFTGRNAFHRGIDFAAPEGSSVLAVAAGVVTYAKDRVGYGKTVEINHGNGYVTRYAHNSNIMVKAGDVVKKGNPIATIGSTGRSTGPHLHFEVLSQNRAVDPMSFVSLKEVQ
jgi:murein DD-endopeptidase MepM/ murein hydrolase activator NlpD